MSDYRDDEQGLFDELLSISEEMDREIELANIAENSLIELKSNVMHPIFDEYYGGNVFSQVMEKGAKKPVLRDPKGGLTAAGRAYFKRKEGANLKPGVMGAANTPEKMRRKGSFLTRFFTNPSGPMKDNKGRATRLALSAAAWGEPVPQNAEDAAKLAAKGRRLLERYKKTKEKGFDTSEFMFKTLSGKNVSLNPFDDDPDMVGLASVDGYFDIYQDEKILNAEEMKARELAVKQMVNLAPSTVLGEKIFTDDYISLQRMAKAAEAMEAKRKLTKAWK